MIEYKYLRKRYDLYLRLAYLVITMLLIYIVSIRQLFQYRLYITVGYICTIYLVIKKIEKWYVKLLNKLLFFDLDIESWRQYIQINRNAKLSQALTLMLLNDFSQLPVMQSERSPNGFISWKTIGEKLAIPSSLSDLENKTVSDFMSDDVVIVTKDETIFSVLTQISKNDFLLIKESTNNSLITGIVTISDLNDQFHMLAKPFLLISEIENGIRQLLDKLDLTNSELEAAKNPNSSETIESIADLSFGGYYTLLGKPDIWSRLGLSLDRQTFIETLDKIREIRNDIMHFDPDGLDDESIKTLEEFAHFLKSLRKCYQKNLI